MIRFTSILVAMLLSFFILEQTILAATDNLTIRLLVGGDTAPPTTPNISNTIPVNDTQIDVSWSPAVDDYLLSGYRVWRDGIQIATTTLTSFSDTGLQPVTLYTYTVDAFDSFSNFSSSSAPVSTTTLATPIITTTPTTTSAQSDGSNLLLKLESLMVNTTTQSAVFSWNTNIPTKYILRWGRTSSYELGSVSSNVSKTQQQTEITQLEPGTKYLYEIVAITGFGYTTTISTGDFFTQSVFTTLSPANVSDFLTQVSDSNVILKWNNPPMADFAYVRLLRNPIFYPQNPYDGALVYEGKSGGIIDYEALAKRSPQYYTIFVYYKDGLVSSGAIARADLVKQADNTTNVSFVPSILMPTSTGSGTDTITIPGMDTTDSGNSGLLPASLVFIEQDNYLQTLNNDLVIQTKSPYSIYIPATSLPPHLKSIVISVQNPTNQRLTTSYLMKINQTGDRYETVLPPPNLVGEARLTLEIFDYQAETVRRISSKIIFSDSGVKTIAFPDSLLMWKMENIIYALGAVISVSALLWFVFRRGKREDNI
jgi:hypothetical protein